LLIKPLTTTVNINIAKAGIKVNAKLPLGLLGLFGGISNSIFSFRTEYFILEFFIVNVFYIRVSCKQETRMLIYVVYQRAAGFFLIFIDSLEISNFKNQIK